MNPGEDSDSILLMEDYKKRLAVLLAETGALFFDRDLILKDGRPTPYFINFGMFRTGRLVMELGSLFADMIVNHHLAEKTDIILGPSYKGSAIAIASSIALYVNHGYDLFFEYDRKEAKTYGEGSKLNSSLVNRTLFDGCRLFIVDDVVTSMGTKYDLMDKLISETEVSNISIEWIGLGIAIDREQSTAVYDVEGRVVPDRRGEDTIGTFVEKTGIPVYSVSGIREVVEYLYQEKVPVLINGTRRPLDNKTKDVFDDYLKTYGIEFS